MSVPPISSIVISRPEDQTLKSQSPSDQSIKAGPVWLNKDLGSALSIGGLIALISIVVFFCIQAFRSRVSRPERQYSSPQERIAQWIKDHGPSKYPIDYYKTIARDPSQKIITVETGGNRSNPYGEDICIIIALLKRNALPNLQQLKISLSEPHASNASFNCALAQLLEILPPNVQVDLTSSDFHPNLEDILIPYLKLTPTCTLALNFPTLPFLQKLPKTSNICATLSQNDLRELEELVLFKNVTIKAIGRIHSFDTKPIVLDGGSTEEELKALIILWRSNRLLELEDLTISIKFKPNKPYYIDTLTALFNVIPPKVKKTINIYTFTEEIGTALLSMKNRTDVSFDFKCDIPPEFAHLSLTSQEEEEKA